MKALKIGIVSLIAMFFGFNLFAQTEDWLWANQAGGTSSDYGQSIATDSNGNSYVTGSFEGIAVFGSTTLTSSGQSDIFVAKMDSNGNWLWAKKAGGSSSDKGYGIAVDSSGNCYVTGYFQSTATFGSTTLTSSGQSDIFVAKMDSNGTWLWAQKAGGSNYDYGYGIAVDNSGNCYVTGYFQSTATFGSTTLTSSGQSDIFVAKMDSNGTWLWAQKAGGSSSDYGQDIAVDNFGNSYVTGYYQGTTVFGSTTINSSGNTDIFIAKLDTNGNYLWAKKAGGTSYDNGYGIATDSNGNSYVTGSFRGTATFGSTSLNSGSTSYYEIFIAKLDTNGNWLWAQKAGGTRSDIGYGIATDSNGNSYVTGYFQGTATFGSTTLNSGSTTITDIFIAKLDTNGYWLWAKKAGGASSDYGYGIATDSNGNSYVTGYFQGTASFGSTSLVSSGGYDIFIAKLDTNGNWLWAQQAGGTSSDYGYGISTDSKGNSYVTGYFAGTATFGSTSLVSSGGSDIFLAKLGTPEYSILAPKGAEHWQAGTVQSAYWSSNVGQSVNVLLSVNNGSTWMMLNSSPVAANLGRFSFTVPFVNSSQCLIKVEGVANSDWFDVSDAPFTISSNPPAAQLYLTAPINDKLQAGKSYAINWIGVGVTSIDLAYSTDAGVSWQSIDTDIAANPGTYLWTVPNASAAMCYLKVSDSSNPAVYDWSDEPFSISSLELTSPIGAELYQTASVRNITWQSEQITNVKLEYSADNGIAWHEIIANTPAASGSYAWTLPALAWDQYRVRISDVGDNGIDDQSENVFSVATLAVTYPSDSGIKLQAGKEYSISWNQEFLPGTLKLELTTNGTTYNTIATGINAALGSYLWTAPDSPSTTCKIRISSEIDGLVLDSSDNNFTISKLELLSPNGFEIWGAQTVKTINWSATHVNNIKLEYSSDDGGNWNIIAASLAAASGSYNWTLPLLHSELCRVRITDVEDAMISDSSDECFTIRPQIILSAPNESEFLTVYNIYSILWSATAEVSFVRLDYSIDGGDTWLPIQTSAYPASVGMYDWIVPNTPSTNCLVKVSRFDNTAINDVSDQAFTITALIQPPTVQFVADITSGLEPLSVQFTDQSTAGTGNITSWLWDFGSGESSTEQHPLYVYPNPGVYSVSLTVTNSADSSASLIREDYIEVIARVPDIELLSAESMSYGVVYLGDTSAAQSIEVKNVGTAPLNIETVSYLLGETPFTLSDTQLPIVLAPDETAILNVVFAPLASGAVSDSIYIHSDADNLPVLAIGLRGTGEYVPPAAVTPPTVQILGNDAIITWEAVTETIYGSPITPDGYIVLYNETPYEDANYYYFLNFVPETSYTHTFVALFRPSMFYRIVAVKFYRESEREAVAGLRNGEDRITWKALKERMQGLHRKPRQ